MILDIVNYGHPALRQKGERVEQITPEIETFISNMLDTMYDASGVGLAAQQVARALQLTVVDVTGMKDRPSTMEINGESVDPEKHMPLVLLNPEITPLDEHETGPEGCLSFPEIYADISRPGRVRVKALDREGKPVEFTCGGLLARAVQHETDHLNGILFIDRMPATTKAALKPELDDLQAETKARLAKAKK